MKKLNYIIIALISMFAISYEVKALTDVECITSVGTQQCTLSGDVVVTEMLEVKGEIELDLNGHTIRPNDGVSISGGLVGVGRGGKLTIKDTVGGGKIASGDKVYAAVQVTLPGENDPAVPATLIVQGGTLEGYYYAITGNGNRHNTNITINGGTLVTTAAAPDGTAIYHPQDGTLTINGGSITGTTGIEIRSGNLIVNGGVIEGTGAPSSVTPNGNGTTTVGAGIAVAQHTTGKNIDVRIKDGTIKGYSAVYESNPQNNQNISSQVNMTITGGDFQAINGGEAVVYSQDLTDFVVRGTFNKAVNPDYVSDSIDTKQVDGQYIIGFDNGNGIDSDSDYDLDATYESEVYVNPIEIYDVDLSWDDLHWVFVYEGDIKNPSRKAWLTKEAYDEISESAEQQSSNEINGEILNSISTLAEPNVGITIANYSTFTVDVLASVESKSNENYTNPAGLKIAQVLTGEPNYEEEVNISALATNANVNLLVKPTATRFVNNSGATANVAGEVKLIFEKTE